MWEIPLHQEIPEEEPEIQLETEIPLEPERAIRPISSTPRLGSRKRKSNREIGQFIDLHGDLKRKQLEADIENKKVKTEMFVEIKEYYKAKRQAIEINNQVPDT